MAFSRADMLATAERSPAAAAAHDRDGWVGLLLGEGGSRTRSGPGRTGTAAIARFYDTFIGPRDITFHRDVDIVVGTTVIRDLELEVKMASTLTHADPRLSALRPARRRWRAENRCAVSILGASGDGGPVSAQRCPGRARRMQLSKGLLSNQGLAGTLGFLSGFRGIGQRW